MSKKTSKTNQDKSNVELKESMTPKEMINKINESNNIDRVVI
jgi:hypothetical protein